MKTKYKISILSFSLGVAGILYSCSSIPKKVQAVRNFNINRYSGTWYEIARFDYRFEKDLNNVSAQYTLSEKGKVIVLNRGYNVVKRKWQKVEGVAKFSGDKNVAALKVSFFGPFYAGYNVVALDSDYQYALIAGKNLNYLWILSRTTTIPDHVKSDYLEIAQKIGYDTSRLVWVKHNKTDNPFLK